MSKNGIVLYDIQMDGCLNGVFTNEPSDGVIYNEIATKKKSLKGESDTTQDCNIEGEYECSWFENGNTPTHRTLKIEKLSGFQRTYTVKWLNGTHLQFEGIGYMMNPRQFAVRYQ